MKGKAQGDDLDASLKTKYSNKVGLCVVLLRKSRAEREGFMKLRTSDKLLSGHVKSGIGQSMSIKMKGHVCQQPQGVGL